MDDPWRYYNETSVGYDQLHGEEQRRKVKAIIELVKPESSWNVLDVGCGTGVSMEGWPCRIVGVEPAEEMAGQAKSKGLTVTVATAENLPFPDDSFDLAIAVTSAHHFKPEAFKEMARVAKRAVISILSKGPVEEIKNRMAPYYVIQTTQECNPDIIFVCQRTEGMDS